MLLCNRNVSLKLLAISSHSKSMRKSQHAIEPNLQKSVGVQRYRVLADRKIIVDAFLDKFSINARAVWDRIGCGC